jgi:hypothetical protein
LEQGALTERLRLATTDRRSSSERHRAAGLRTRRLDAIYYMLKRWAAFICFLDDGRICLTNNATVRALRDIALGRKA